MKLMDTVKGYFDYYISEKCITAEDFTRTKDLLVKLGYHTIAINQIVDESNLEPKKKKKKGESREIVDIVPPPINVSKYQDNGDIKILNRLTIIFSNQDIFTRIIKSPNYKKYHIIAILPLTQSAIQFTCSNVDADILSYNPENKISYKLSRKIYNQLIEKNFYFELLYAPAIQDSTQRKNVIHLSHIYHSFGKSQNIIISSGAASHMLLRSPYDIINLGIIFGLSEDRAKNSILHCGRKLYLNSLGRSYGKTMIYAQNLNKNEEADILRQSDEEDEEMRSHEPAQKKTKQ